MNKFTKLRLKMFDNNNDISLQLFNVMFTVLLIGSVVATIVTCCIDFDPMILTVLILSVASTAFALWLANYKQKMKTAGIIISCILNFALEPMLYLTTGGRPSGMVTWALLAFIFNFLIVEGIASYVLAVLGIGVYIGCLYIELYDIFPVYNIPTVEGQVIDLIVSTIAVTLIIGIIFKYQKYAYNRQKRTIEFKDAKIRETLRNLEQTNLELERASKAKGDFLANMSHEIRTPINAILGLNELISRESKQDSISEYSQNIKTAGDTLLSLINDILDFSKIESGKMQLIQTEYETASQINSIITMILLKATDKGLKFNVDVDPRFPIKLYGDELKIKQIITNLCNNAIKYTNVGQVDLKITIDDMKENRIIYTVAVKDTGIGIKDADREKLFESFTRLDEQKNRNIEGTGLGVSISQNYLEMMGTRLNVESEYGKGSTFSFKICQKIIDPSPIGDIGQALKKHVENKVKNNFIAPRAKALMVDDVELNCKVAIGLLKPIGMQIDKALSGQEAIDKCKKEKYDLIFMDHMMPQMDGIEATHHIREIDRYYEQVPIIALTANAVVGAKDMFIESGMQDFVSKPISMEEIINVIEKWLPQELIEYLNRSSSDNVRKEIKIPHISGINEEAALKILGSKELLLETLVNFHDSIAERANAIKEYEENNDIENYTIQVHALKSLARTIGAEELAELALYLEQCGKELNITEIKRKTPELIDKYMAFESKLEILCSHDIDKGTIKNEVLITYLKDLLANIEDYNLEKAEQLLKDIGKFDLGVNKGKFEKIRSSINAIDFESSKKYIKDFISSI
ncbi:MAG: ATP-binding protein [Clostridia bacterium]|nr:ATP-binding protein [Clostridia bacterium]